MLVIEHLPAGEAVADKVPLVPLPHDFLVLGDLEDLRVFITGVAVADDAVAVGQFLKAGHPAEADVGAGHLAFDFPDDLFLRRDLHDAFAAAGGDEGVAVLQANGAVHARLDEVIPNHLAIVVVFGDDAWLL